MYCAYEQLRYFTLKNGQDSHRCQRPPRALDEAKGEKSKDAGKDNYSR